MVIVNDEKTIEDLLKKKGITLLYFSSPTCSACGAIKEKLEVALKNFPKISAYEIPPFNTDEILASFSIFTFPAILLYIDGKEYIREARYFSVENLIKDINRYYELCNEE
ncbi:thioredoxin family protein [Clostridium sardiniense]|uniref:thioredoxin family protein n=1 Tax=Clostridium sardiniense TaxID=29369 RepID=UPI00195886A3|nr:thioredoxin family protein [Clostridium sardiniense]MBM7835531.1 thiol-disulfide isomerase/thioredoxin [Clostridium sardiniense]